jgi:uncharacterized protein YdaT
MANQHVVRHSTGGWAIKKEGSERASKVFETQSDAIEKATEIAKNQKVEIFIHDRHGRIRERNSFEKDPFPPRG